MLVHLPTGAGKTVIFSHLAQLARRQVLVLAHREELLTQARDKLQRALGGAAGVPVVAIERGALRAPPDARVLVCSIRSLHEERLAKRAARARRGADRLRRVPPRGRRGQPARAAPARRLRANFHGHAARLHRHHGARRRPGPRAGLRGDRLLARPARADRGRLPRAAARLPHRDHGRPAPAVSSHGPRLRRGAAGRGRRHRGAQRAGRAVDPGAGARSPDHRVLRDGEPRPQPGPRAERARRSRRASSTAPCRARRAPRPWPTSARDASRSSRTWAS